MTNLLLPDMSTPIETEFASSLIAESIRIEIIRLNDGIFSPKVVEPIALFIFGLAMYLLMTASSESAEMLPVNRVVTFVCFLILFFHVAHVVREDLRTFRQAHIRKLLRQIQPSILEYVYSEHIETIRSKISYSCFFRLSRKEVIAHIARLSRVSQWKHLKIFWIVRYSILAMGIIILSFWFHKVFIVTVLAPVLFGLCFLHVLSLNRLASSSYCLEKLLHVINIVLF